MSIYRVLSSAGRMLIAIAVLFTIIGLWVYFNGTSKIPPPIKKGAVASEVLPVGATDRDVYEASYHLASNTLLKVKSGMYHYSVTNVNGSTSDDGFTFTIIADAFVGDSVISAKLYCKADSYVTCATWPLWDKE